MGSGNENTHANNHIIPIDNLGYLWDYLHVVEPTPEIIEKVRREAREHKEYAKPFYTRSRTIDLLSRSEYNRHLDQIKRLTPRLDGLNDTLKGFVWSWWNLFKGWNGDYRRDDPAKTAEYRETIRPSGFSPDLWKFVQELYIVIQDLKKLPKNPKLETGLLDILTKLADEWNFIYGDKRRKYREIYPFNSADWQCLGKQHGHNIYQLKKP